MDYCPRHASENPKLPAKLKAEIRMWDWPQRLMGCGRMSNIGHHAYQTNVSQTVGFLKRKYYDSWASSVWDDNPRPKELDLLAVSFWQLELKTDKPWIGSGQELGITFIGPPSGVMAASGAPELDIGIFSQVAGVITVVFLGPKKFKVWIACECPKKSWMEDLHLILEPSDRLGDKIAANILAQTAKVGSVEVASASL